MQLQWYTHPPLGCHGSSCSTTSTLSTEHLLDVMDRRVRQHPHSPENTYGMSWIVVFDNIHTLHRTPMGRHGSSCSTTSTLSTEHLWDVMDRRVRQHPHSPQNTYGTSWIVVFDNIHTLHRTPMGRHGSSCSTTSTLSTEHLWDVMDRRVRQHPHSPQNTYGMSWIVVFDNIHTLHRTPMGCHGSSCSTTSTLSTEHLWDVMDRRARQHPHSPLNTSGMSWIVVFDNIHTLHRTPLGCHGSSCSTTSTLSTEHLWDVMDRRVRQHPHSPQNTSGMSWIVVLDNIHTLQRTNKH